MDEPKRDPAPTDLGRFERFAMVMKDDLDPPVCQAHASRVQFFRVVCSALVAKNDMRDHVTALRHMRLARERLAEVVDRLELALASWHIAGVELDEIIAETTRAAFTVCRPADAEAARAVERLVDSAAASTPEPSVPEPGPRAA